MSLLPARDMEPRCIDSSKSWKARGSEKADIEEVTGITFTMADESFETPMSLYKGSANDLRVRCRKGRGRARAFGSWRIVFLLAKVLDLAILEAGATSSTHVTLISWSHLLMS